jgi:perosamine synthetase
MTFYQPLPALLGGAPVRPSGPPGWPVPDDDVSAALQSAYADGSWGKYHGGRVEELELALRAYFQIDHALPVSSGTVAVELALRSLKIGPGDEVILSAYDYPGNFLCVHAVGASPVLVDVHPANWNLDPDNLAAAISPPTRALIVSHLHGGLVPMAQVMEIARQHALAVIEDAAQCPGAMVQGRKAGTWGDAGILSFGGSKLLTAGRGGAVLTRRPDIAQRLRLLLNRGNHICPLSELQAAVLLPQLAKLDARNAHRAANAAALIAQLPEAPLQVFRNTAADSTPAYYKLGFQYDPAAYDLPRAVFVAAMRAEGIALDEGFRGLHAGRSASRFRSAGDLVHADEAHQRTIILHHPALLGTSADMADIAVAARKVLDHAHLLPR